MTRAKSQRPKRASRGSAPFREVPLDVKATFRVGADKPLFFLVAFSAAAILVRSYAASHIGFGDSEALYATYALHPAPAYLDHPGLVGNVMRVLGDGSAPSPVDAHRFTAFATTLVPFVLAASARLAGAKWKRALWTALVVAAAPEISVGLFALTPDLLLAFTWPVAIGLAALALRERVGSFRANGAWALALLLAGIATLAKASGALLLVSLLAVPLVVPSARKHAKTWGPWAGLALALLVLWPVLAYEQAFHFPLLHHRLVDTASFAPTVKSVAAFLLAQLVYVGPVLLWLVIRASVRLFRAVGRWDAVDDLLAVTTFVPLAVLLVFSLLNRVAEPHWIAPPLLALALFVAREGPGRATTPAATPPADAIEPANEPTASRRDRFAAAAFSTGLILTAALHAWVLVPASAHLLPEGRETKLDIANELYGWPRALAVAREMITSERAGGGPGPVVVTPHWVLSAQLAAGLGEDVPVGCDMPIATDFDAWQPAIAWKKADSILFVTDGRFPVDVEARFPDRHVTSERSVSILRGARIVRTFRLTLLSREALGSL